MQIIENIVGTLAVMTIVVVSIILVVWFCFVQVPEINYQKCVAHGAPAMVCSSK